MYYCKFLVMLSTLNLMFLGTLGGEWVKPDAWGRHVHSSAGEEKDPECFCGKSEQENNEIMFNIYYKKLVGNLFHRNKLLYDESKSMYVRSVAFTLSPEELERIDKCNDAREMDSILSKILEESKTITVHYRNNDDSHLYTLFRRTLMDLLQLMKSTEILFTFLAVGYLIILWYVSRHFNMSIVFLLIFSPFIIGYIITYYECNRKLETEDYVKFLRTDANKESNGWNFFPFNYFKTPSKEKEINNFRDSQEMKLPFCTPDTVFFMYMNKIFVNYIKFLLVEVIMLVRNLPAQVPFPFNYIAIATLPIFVAYIVKLFFKYILRPREWAQLLHPDSHHQRVTNVIHSARIEHAEDRVSGDNLKMLLNVINSHNTTSGVQELTEKPEAASNACSGGICPCIEKVNKADEKILTNTNHTHDDRNSR